MLAALLMAGAAFAACSSDNDFIGETTTTQTASKTYTLVISADKGKTATRALTIDPTTSKLVASWKTGEVVEVYNASNEKLGEITAKADGESTTFKGELTGTVAKGDVLTLKFLSPSYANQDGTLSYIAANCDYATATLTVADIDETGMITTQEDRASFTNQQSITKFTLYDKNVDTPIALASLTISLVMANPTATTPTTLQTFNLTNLANAYSTNGANGVIYIALPNKSYLLTLIPGATAETLDTYLASMSVVFTTSDGAFTYTLTKNGYPFPDNSYNKVNVRMTRAINLTPLGESVTARDGETITGNLGNSVQIKIADKATVTLKDVSINPNGDGTGRFAGITCEGDATIILEGENTVKGFSDKEPNYGKHYHNPGIFVPKGKTLTIEGDGTLIASSNGGNSSAAGIGSSSNTGSQDCGNIVINSGIIIATGGSWNSSGGAGIGAGDSRSCGTITINGGTVTATGGNKSAGIGLGSSSPSCGAITINGGTVTANSGSYSFESAVAIGGNPAKTIPSITISKNVDKLTMKANSPATNVGKFLGVSSGNSITIGDNTLSSSDDYPTSLAGFSSTINGSTWELTPVAP